MMDAVVLVGGRGERLREDVPELPKVLAPVRGIPFLRFLLDSLDRFGIIRRAVFTLAYRGDQVESFVRSKAARWRFEPSFTREESLLGTGGGIRLALSYTEGESALVLNGDTFLSFDPRLLASALEHSRALVALAACRVPDAGRFGALLLEPSGDPGYERVLGFEEKGCSGEGWINGGVYLLRREAYLSRTPEGRGFSIEREVLPDWVRRDPGSVVAVRQVPAGFLDIGEPQAYRGAESFLVRQGLLDHV